jgi:GGDEF domain-containing protein
MREIKHPYLPDSIILNKQLWGDEEIWVATFGMDRFDQPIRLHATGDTVLEAVRNILKQIVATEMVGVEKAKQILWDF